MLNLFIVFAGLLAILFLEEFSWKQKILSNEGQRKFGHIALGAFTASWPWLISWNQIKLLGVGAVIFSLVNYYTKIFHYLGLVKRGGYGDIFFALAIISCALLTNVKFFFAISIMVLALADSVAALAGQRWGKPVSYKVLGQPKSLVGTLAFWVAALFVVGVGGLLDSNMLTYAQYLRLILILPPVLAALENISILGVDNLLVPVAAVGLLRLLT